MRVVIHTYCSRFGDIVVLSKEVIVECIPKNEKGGIVVGRAPTLVVGVGEKDCVEV